MYAKLFSRIAQSSLMEEKVSTRYVFMMMLALSDRHGDVIGTDVAIARMMNVSKDEFHEALAPLLAPDLDSNSQAEEGRRLVPSENGRGYKVVNYECYRDMKSDEEKREYMRNYMRERRAAEKDAVKPVKKCKAELSDVTHTEVDTNTNTDTLPPNPQRGEAAPSLPHHGDFREAWSRWEKHRREIKKPLRPTQTEAQLKKLATMTEARAVAMIDHTIEMGWQGLREGEQVKGSEGNKKSQSTLQELMGGRKLNITKASDIENNEHEFENEPDF